MVELKSPDEIKRIAEACRIVAEVLEDLKEAVAPGITTAELEKIADDGIRKRGGVPAFKGYRGYPASLCTSVNNEVVHGIPSKRRLVEGDIISLDLGVSLKGYFGDSAITLPVGSISDQARALMDATLGSLTAGISSAEPGNRVSDISNAVQRHVEGKGFSIVRDFVGHGIGKNLHEEPQIPNFGMPGRGMRLRAGMTLAIEPMVNAGGYGIEILHDGWTAVTADGSLSAHFEHTLAITENGASILTELQ